MAPMFSELTRVETPPRHPPDRPTVDYFIWKGKTVFMFHVDSNRSHLLGK